MARTVFITLCTALLILMSANITSAQDESAEDIEMPLLDKEGNLTLFIRAKKIDSRFNIVVKGYDDEFSGYIIQDISVFIPQSVGDEKRIMLAQAKNALYVSELKMLEISDKAVMYMLPKIYGQSYKIDEQNLLNYDMRIQTEKLMVKWVQADKTEGEDDSETEENLVPEVTSQEKIVLDYPQQGLNFKGTGFTYREGSLQVRVHKDVELNYFQSQNRDSIDLDNETASSFKLTGTKGAVVNFFDTKDYRLKSIEVTGAVRFIQRPQNSQLSCDFLSILMKDASSKDLVFEKIVAEGNVGYLTPNKFNLGCEKLEIFYENKDNVEKFLGVFTEINRVIIFTDNAKELFGAGSADKENLFTYYMCSADDKIIFEREFNRNSQQEVCGFEKWRFLDEAKIERKIVRLDISQIEKGELIDKASYLEGRKIPGKIESSQVDMVLQGKEEISFYFELRCSNNLMDTDESITRSLTRLEVKNSANRSTLEFMIESMGTVHVFAEGLIFVQTSETESQLTVTGSKPSLILKTSRDLRFTELRNSPGNLFRYILTAETSIFVNIKFNSGFNLENLTIVTKDGIEIRKTPLRLTEAALPEHYATLKAYDVEIILAQNLAGDLELSEFTAHSKGDQKILYEISNNRIETEYLKYESRNLPYANIEIDENALPNWKLIYSPYTTSLTLKGRTMLQSSDSELNKLVTLNNMQGAQVVPSMLTLNSDKTFIYSATFLRGREKYITLNNKLELGENIDVSVFDNDDRLLHIEGKNLVLDSMRDLTSDSVKIREFHVSGKSKTQPAVLDYVYRDLLIKASEISINKEDPDKIEMKGAPSITFTISNIQTINPSESTEKSADQESEFQIFVKFPETDDEKVREKQTIVANGFIESLKITSRCEILIQDKNNAENMVQLHADEVIAGFSDDPTDKQGISLEISKIEANGNVQIADGKREVNGDKLIWDMRKGVSLKLEGENSVLSEKRDGKTIYLIKGITNYEFQDKSEKVRSRRNVITLNSKKGIKIRVNR